MRALQLPAAGGSLEVMELPDPQPAAGEVLVRVEACGIGLTVVNATREQGGRRPAKLPRVPGHELVGTIVGVGDGVDPARIGGRVLAYYYLFCGECRRCVSSSEPLCERLGGHVGVSRDGGYAELVALPARNALPVPGSVDSVDATVIADAVATPVHVAGRAGIGPGDRVAVIGAGGGVGSHMLQVARAFGADVAGLDVSVAKLDFLENVVGVAAVDSTDFGSVDLPAGWSGKADVVVDFVGTEASRAWGVETLGTRGRLVFLTSAGDLAAPARAITGSELSLIGSRYASRAEVGFAASLVASGRVRPAIGRKVGPDGVEQVHGELRAGALLGRGALLWE